MIRQYVQKVSKTVFPIYVIYVSNPVPMIAKMNMSLGMCLCLFSNTIPPANSANVKNPNIATGIPNNSDQMLWLMVSHDSSWFPKQKGAPW